MTDPQAPQPSFWSQFWERMVTVFKWVGVKLLAPGVALIVIVLAIVLVSMGLKDLQIGGLLGLLFGKKSPEQKAIDVANTVPPNRVDPNGKVIQPGTPDTKGDTQAIVVPIKDPGLFANPDTISFTPPGSTQPIEIQLPDGVKNKDVQQVIVVQPGKFVVTVKDNSGIPAQKVDDLLSKYGG